MTSTAITNFIPPVQVEAPNVSRILMVDAIRQALIDFCTRTRYWRYECDALTTTDEVAEYELDIPVQTECVSIRTMLFDGFPLTEKNMDWLDENERGWRTKTGKPKYYVLRNQNTLILSRLPSADIEIAATVALAPSETATTCEDILLEKCRDAISSGALYRLKRMVNKPWSDTNGAELFHAEYERQVTNFKKVADEAYGTRSRTRSRANFI